MLEKQVQELTYQMEDDQRSYEASINDRDAQIRKMREECQALLVELQMLLDTKQTLDAEMPYTAKCWRERRIELACDNSWNRSSRHTACNSMMILDEPLDEWKLKRKIDGRKEIVFTLPSKYVLKAGKSVKIWAKNQGGVHNPPDQLIFEGEENWSIGSNVQTILYNKEGEERATNIQRSSSTQSAPGQTQVAH